jgi:predicted transcriptional regulator
MRCMCIEVLRCIAKVLAVPFCIVDLRMRLIRLQSHVVYDAFTMHIFIPRLFRSIFLNKKALTCYCNITQHLQNDL